MSNKITEAAKTNKPVAHDLLFDSPVSSNDQILFQVFFLSEDQSQGVEVLETDEIDFNEIVLRLKMGDSIFIKHKNQNILDPYSGSYNEDEHSVWYFTHC